MWPAGFLVHVALLLDFILIASEHISTFFEIVLTLFSRRIKFIRLVATIATVIVIYMDRLVRSIDVHRLCLMYFTSKVNVIQICAIRLALRHQMVSNALLSSFVLWAQAIPCPDMTLSKYVLPPWSRIKFHIEYA